MSVERDHLEQDKNYSRKYREEHPKQVKDSVRKWNKEHPEKVKEYGRKWREENKQRDKERARKWHEEHREQVKERHKKWYRENLEQSKERHYQRYYGISLKEKQSLVDKQQGRCAICRDPVDINCGHVDHDHRAPRGKGIRGILCSKCNQGLGLFKDNEKILSSAIEYLVFWQKAIS